MGWQISIMKKQIGELPSAKSNARIEREKALLKRLYRPVFGMAGMLLLVWVPFFPGSKTPSPGGMDIMPSFGMVRPFDLASPKLYVLVNGSTLSRYAKDCHLGAVAFRYYGAGDIKDTPKLQKSGLYDIDNSSLQ